MAINDDKNTLEIVAEMSEAECETGVFTDVLPANPIDIDVVDWLHSQLTVMLEKMPFVSLHRTHW
jgi:hypothetical protein